MAKQPSVPHRAPSTPKKSTEQNVHASRKHRTLMILARAAVIILLLIPSYIAIAHYFVRKNNPIVAPETTYSAVVCESPTGVELRAERSEDKNADMRLLQIFERLLTGASSVDTLPEGLSPAYRVSMYTNTGSEHYSFYFSVQNGTCYFTDAAGQHRFATPASAEAFLNSPFAFDLYAQATPPVLTTAATDEIIPSALSWNYRTQNGTITELTHAKTTAERVTYPIANDVAFYFSLEPTDYTVTIRRGGDVLEFGKDERIVLPALSEDELLNFEIRAEYFENASTDYYGTVTYRFDMRVVEAATFATDRAAATVGDYVLLSCRNVRNAEKLVITGAPALDAAPIVFRRGDGVFAMIPLSHVGAQRLTVTYGTISDSFDLTVSDSSASVSHTLTQADLRGWSPTLESELAGWITDKGATADSGAPLLGRFDGYDGIGTRVFAFGDTLRVDGATPLTLPFELYSMADNVPALHGGVVREVGTHAVLGNYVILDHGGGLYSHYCGLSAVYVSTSQTVSAGQALGLAGMSGLGRTGESSVLVMVTLGRVAIAPDYLREHAFAIQ